MMRLVLLLLALAVARPAIAAEQIVAGLSENQIAITANFNGSDILVFGAVKRSAPIPDGKPLQVIVTIAGPPTPVNISRKGHVAGLWINTDTVRVTSAPSFYAIATSGPMNEVLSQTDDLRYRITIPRAIHDVGIAGQAQNAANFIEALLRIRARDGLYVVTPGSVTVEQSTLFRTDVKLPANLTEGVYKVSFYLTRDGKVVANHHTDILVRKTGLERWLYLLAKAQPAIYGLLSLVIAIVAGWLASAAFQLLKR